MRDFTPTATVIADSLSVAGHRLTTIEVTLHRFVLAELNTHRAFSRNSASSRAIPVAKTMKRLAETPAIPLAWPQEQPGMAAHHQIAHILHHSARSIWLEARDAAVAAAEQLAALGVHKSVTNRLLEPFMTTTVIISATEWENFFTQRCSPLAQPEMQACAEAIRVAHHHSVPTPVSHGGWHLPYLDPDTRRELRHSPHLQCYVSAARCARVSYLTHDGRRDWQADYDLYRRLIRADPPHASPLEHVATPADHPPGNFTGWRQLRHDITTQGSADAHDHP